MFCLWDGGSKEEERGVEFGNALSNWGLSLLLLECNVKSSRDCVAQKMHKVCVHLSFFFGLLTLFKQLLKSSKTVHSILYLLLVDGWLTLVYVCFSSHWLLFKYRLQTVSRTDKTFFVYIFSKLLANLHLRFVGMFVFFIDAIVLECVKMTGSQQALHKKDTTTSIYVYLSRSKCA